MEEEQCHVRKRKIPLCWAYCTQQINCICYCYTSYGQVTWSFMTSSLMACVNCGISFSSYQRFHLRVGFSPVMYCLCYNVKVTSHNSYVYWVRLNSSAPNVVYVSRTAQLTSRRCILNIYSTNVLNEYFKHAAHSPFFFSLSLSLQDAVYVIKLSFLVPVIFTF